MWQKLKAKFSKLPTIGITRRNFLMISADIRKGTVIVSYKGKVKYGHFLDNTLRHLVKPDKFNDNAEEFLTAVGKLINKVIE